jgi:eukaryotic-like serine/threonine-protein kinase
MSHAWTEATNTSAGQGSGRKESRTGTMLFGWRLERLLGAGTVCESWLASKAGAPDAVVRILREPFASDPVTRAEWLGASWAANRFMHPLVPRVLQDGADARGAPVVVRRWASGRSLEEAAHGEGMMDPRRALYVAEQLLDALEMAHAHGIVHGSLSPSNVVVTARGTLRLLDFAAMPGLVEPTLGLARARVSPYMAPQQRAPLAEDDPSAFAPPSEQSDVWSVGACLYFAIAGRAPALEGPSLRRAVAGTEPNLGAVVDRALAIDPLERYESAYAMLGDIRRVAAGRKPRLQSAGQPLPSGGPEALGRESSSGVVGLESSEHARTDASSPDALLDPAAGGPARSEWLGNLLLFAAIALIVGVATFVLVREQIADGAASGPAPRAAPGGPEPR